MLALDFDRDAIMPVAPIDLLFSRATAAHVVSLHVAGRAVVDDGRLTGVDLDDAHEKLREQYRDRIATREPFLAAWFRLEPAAAAFYRERFGCC